MIKLQKVEVLQTQQPDAVRNFSNPVCKQTFYSLPRIYGKKKKLTRQDSSPPREAEKKQQQDGSKPKRHLSSYQLSSNSRAKRQASQSRLLSVASHTSGCTKQNCSCNKIEENSAQKTKKKFLSTYNRQPLLPEIRKFDLEDLESQHKVSLQGTMTKTNFRRTGLDLILEQNQKLKSKNDSPKNQKSQKAPEKEKQKLEDKKAANANKSNLSSIKNRYKFKPKINNPRFQIEQQSDQQKITDENLQQSQQQKKHQRRESSRYKTQVNDSESPRSNNSISLTSLLFRGTKRQNTNFYDLNLSEKSMEKKLLNRKPSQLSNGLFRIPQEQEYADYLRGYKNVGENFNIKKVALKPGFKIQKYEKGVYFGEFDSELRRHGEGINVTQKQIFEGKFDKNVKTSGCERNIDGVYIGEFKNGLRSGHGVFRWNNGEIFEGNWQNGMKNGYGVWKSPKGDVYEGQWVQNRQHGEGVFKHRASIYKGQFKNFLKDGYGCENFVNGDCYEGQYKDGKPHGKGHYKWHSGGHYDGQFSKGMREGRGKWVDENGTIYEGYFKSDFKHGFGKQIYSSGERYEGQFSQGARTEGKLYDKSNNFIQISESKW